MDTKKLISLLVMALCVAIIPAACSDGDNGDGTGEPDPVTQKGYRYTGIFDVTVDHAIEAGDKTGVEADLKANPPLPQGAPYRYRYTIQRYAAALPPSVTLTYADGNGDEVVGLVTQTSKDPGMMPDTYRLLPPATSVSGCMEWRVETGGIVLPYDVFIHTPVPSSFAGSYIYLYEDLTGKYQQMFPDADVTAVVRRQTLTCKSWERIILE